MLRQKMLVALLALFIFFGCVGMQETQTPAATGTAPGQPGAVQPVAQEPACAVPEGHCAYDNVSQLLTCGSGYQIGGAAISNGSYYWVDKCQPISTEPGHLITLIGPFESEEEYDEYISEGEAIIARYRNMTRPVNGTALNNELEELQAKSFNGKRRSDYVNFLYTASGTYPINNETSIDSVAKKILASMGSD